MLVTVVFLLYPIPLQRSTDMAAAHKTPFHSPNAVKYQHLPAASINGCRIAILVAAIAYLITLVVAAAVLGL